MPNPDSVWDYPRPPTVEPSSERITVVLGGRTTVDTIAGEVVTPQEGDFYGGWITSRVTGP